MALAKAAFPRLLTFFALSPAQAGNFYCCQDPTSGRRVCGDVLPDQCKGRAFKIIDGAGNIIREEGPPLTAEQKTQIEVDSKRKKELEEFQRTHRRKDAALL